MVLLLGQSCRNIRIDMSINKLKDVSEWGMGVRNWLPPLLASLTIVACVSFSGCREPRSYRLAYTL